MSITDLRSWLITRLSMCLAYIAAKLKGIFLEDDGIREEISQADIKALVVSSRSFKHDGEFFHSLTLRDGSTVTGSSLTSEHLAEWNAEIRLQTLVENGRIKIDGRD